MTKLRMLRIDDEVRDRIAAVMKYAEENPYIVGGPVPGDILEHVLQLDDYRAVFSYTHVNGIVARHLSVSIPGPDFPNVLAVLMIASELGFTGWTEDMGVSIPEGWVLDVDKELRFVMMAQAIPAGGPEEKPATLEQQPERVQ